MQSQPHSVPFFPQRAHLDFYRRMIEDYGGENSAAARYADRVIGRVQGHDGGPSLHERRVKWETTHPMGPSGRTFRPDDFAFVLAAKLWGDSADARCAALGLHPRWLDCVRGRLESDTVELKQLAVNSQIFTREMLGALIRAQLPGKLCEAGTPLEWQRVVSTALRLPGWVLDAAEAPAPAHAQPSLPGDPAAQAAALPTAQSQAPAAPAPAFERRGGKRRTGAKRRPAASPIHAPSAPASSYPPAAPLPLADPPFAQASSTGADGYPRRE